MMTGQQLALEFVNKYKNNTFKKPSMPVNIRNKCDWIMNDSRLPWLKIVNIEVPYKEMLKEAQDLDDLFVDHRGENGTGWHSLCIHGLSASMTNAAQAYGIADEDAQYIWTEIIDRCPVTTKFFKENFYYDQYARLRFMRLVPGGYIQPHVDNDNYSLSPINISLNNPAECRLVCDQGTVPFDDSGSVIMFNTSYQHAALNATDITRYHIIVHGRPIMQFWHNKIIESYEAA